MDTTTPDQDRDIAERLRVYMARRQIGICDLASEIGVSRWLVADWRNGLFAGDNRRRVVDIVDALDRPIADTAEDLRVYMARHRLRDEDVASSLGVSGSTIAIWRVGRGGISDVYRRRLAEITQGEVPVRCGGCGRLMPCDGVRHG